jgi:hypothetical protein
MLLILPLFIVLSSAATQGSKSLWKLPIPYTISSSMNSMLIESALLEWTARTGIQFVKHTTEEDFISFEPGERCHTEIGKIGGKQEISLNNRCANAQYEILDEIGHALGLGHEHQRPDRDNFVQIFPENVRDGYLEWFEKKEDYIPLTPYDYLSSTHFHWNQYSKNTKPTILSKRRDHRVPSMFPDLSDYDVYGVCKMYQLGGCLYNSTLVHSEGEVARQPRLVIS